jgi:hypothetical protein
LIIEKAPSLFLVLVQDLVGIKKKRVPLSPLHLSVNNTLARNIEKHGLAVQGSDF